LQGRELLSLQDIGGCRQLAVHKESVSAFYASCHSDTLHIPALHSYTMYNEVNLAYFCSP
jgi:hypothetical protein